MKYIKLLRQYKNEILFLSYQKVKTQHLETFLGMGWAIVKPMTFVMTFWLFFTVGLRSGAPVGGHPFLLFLFSGYIPWMFISENISTASKVISGNAPLVKNIKFPVMALPLINFLSKFYIHVVLVAIVAIIYVIIGGMDYMPDIYFINFIYYWFTMMVFFTGLGFVLGSLNVVIKDIGPLVNAIMQPLFWITPIFYIPYTPKLDLFMKLLNPLYYFILGYRDTLLYKHFFWEEIWYDIYIWILIFIIYFIAYKVWNKIRPLMADLL